MKLDPLDKAICDFVNCLKPGGRMLVITFHSLEDRLVKRCFQRLQNPMHLPAESADLHLRQKAGREDFGARRGRPDGGGSRPQPARAFRQAPRGAEAGGAVMPTLYVVGTPIGNLQDMTPRAIDTLRRVALIAAEDTRVTKKLLTVFDIDTPLTACHQHNEDTKGEYLADKMLADNIDIALTTDAGTPCISDPGYALVKACVDRGIEVLAIPGCCASISALSVSGFDTREFAFYGFLPREKKDLREKLLQMARQVPIAAVHESPFRVVELVEVVCDTLPGCRISASCDLTKLHEKTIRGDAADVLRQLRENPKAEKGEYCLILDFHDVRLPEEKSPAADVSLEARLIDEMVRNGLTLRDAQSELVLDGEKEERGQGGGAAAEKSSLRRTTHEDGKRADHHGDDCAFVHRREPQSAQGRGGGALSGGGDRAFRAREGLAFSADEKTSRLPARRRCPSARIPAWRSSLPTSGRTCILRGFRRGGQRGRSPRLCGGAAAQERRRRPAPARQHGR